MSTGPTPVSDGAWFDYSPDGTSLISIPGTILGTPYPTTHVNPTVIDVATGKARTVDWQVGSVMTWQRLAPYFSPLPTSAGRPYTPRVATRGDARGETLEPVGRILAFDLARGLAIVFMILIHVLRHWGDPATWTTPIGTVISFLGGPLAARSSCS